MNIERNALKAKTILTMSNSVVTKLFLFRQYKERLVSLIENKKMKELSKYREHVTTKRMTQLKELVEEKKQKAEETGINLEETTLAKEKLFKKMKELERAREAEKERAMEATADKLKAENSLNVLETRKMQLEQEKKKLKVVAEQEKRKAAEAAERERETAKNVHSQELSRIAAEIKLEEVENRNSKLENELALLEERLGTGNHTFLQNLKNLWQFILNFIAYIVLLRYFLEFLKRCLFG